MKDADASVDHCGTDTPYGCGGSIRAGAHYVAGIAVPRRGYQFATRMEDNGSRLFHADCCPCKVPGMTRPIFRERLLAEWRARVVDNQPTSA